MIEEQLPLDFDAAVAKVGIEYQKTSREAWRSFLPVSAKLDREIMQIIDNHGLDGVTCCNIEHLINRSHQAVSGNLRHLVEKRLVNKTRLRGSTPSGRAAIKWVAASHYQHEIHGGAT